MLKEVYGRQLTARERHFGEIKLETRFLHIFQVKKKQSIQKKTRYINILRVTSFIGLYKIKIHIIAYYNYLQHGCTYTLCKYR